MLPGNWIPCFLIVCFLNNISNAYIQPSRCLFRKDFNYYKNRIQPHFDTLDATENVESAPNNPSQSILSVDSTNLTESVTVPSWRDYLPWNGADQQRFTKEAIGKAGLNVLLAYGFVSNVAYITCFITAWVVYGKTHGVSPLAAGKWGSFLLIYSGFVAFNNIIRPLRYGLSLAISPIFNNFVDQVEMKTGYKRATATSIVVFIVNIVGSTTYMGLGLFLATKVFRVPLFPAK